MDNMDKQGFIFGALFALANRLQILGDKFDSNITIKQWLFIAVISKMGHLTPTISEVAAVAGYSRQNVKRVASALEKQGLIQLIRDESDARVLRVSLTEQCKAYFKQREADEELFLNQLFAGFDEKMLNGLYDGLVQLSNNMVTMEHSNE